MEPSSPRRRRAIPLLLIVVAILGLLGAGYGYFNAWTFNRKLERSVEKATRLRIWAAGIRTNPDGKFCPCALVPKPERVLYETTDPKEIEALVSSIRARPCFGEPSVLVEACSNVTMDFLHDERLLLSLHPQGDIVRSCFVSWWNMPVSGGSREDIEAWLHQRGLRARLDAAMREGTASPK